MNWAASNVGPGDGGNLLGGLQLPLPSSTSKAGPEGPEQGREPLVVEAHVTPLSGHLYDVIPALLTSQAAVSIDAGVDIV